MTSSYLSLWLEARTRFSGLLDGIAPSDLAKKLSPAPNSAGFLIRHIADVELLFSKNVFGMQNLKVSAQTVIDKRDSGEWTDLMDLLDYQSLAFSTLQTAIQAQDNAGWEQIITTREFGSKSKSEALGRIVSHTAYHAGQVAMILKYGSF